MPRREQQGSLGNMIYRESLNELELFCLKRRLNELNVFSTALEEGNQLSSYFHDKQDKQYWAYITSKKVEDTYGGKFSQ